MVPILANKHYRKPSVFEPANLLKQARRQKSLPSGSVPGICVLDPDGDLSSYIRDSSAGKRNPYWACYHTDLYSIEIEGLSVGVIGRAVGYFLCALGKSACCRNGGRGTLCFCAGAKKESYMFRSCHKPNGYD
jgi:hypothetical protein